MWENSNKYTLIRHTSTFRSFMKITQAFQEAEQYIKSGEGLSSVRHIFHKFPFDQFEEDSLAQLKAFIARNGIAIPTNWNEPELLRVLYSARFNIPAAARLVHDHVIWLNNTKLHQMTASKINLIVMPR